MKYVIHSKSERSFWNVRKGWVHKASDATKFTREQRKGVVYFPFSFKNDAEFVVIEYGE